MHAKCGTRDTVYVAAVSFFLCLSEVGRFFCAASQSSMRDGRAIPLLFIPSSSSTVREGKAWHVFQGEPQRRSSVLRAAVPRLDKGDKTFRILHDGTHSARVNAETQSWDQVRTRCAQLSLSLTRLRAQVCILLCMQTCTRQGLKDSRPSRCRRQMSGSIGLAHSASGQPGNGGPDSQRLLVAGHMLSMVIASIGILRALLTSSSHPRAQP